MNEKLNIQNLIDMLAEKHGMNRIDAERFVKGFFLLIEEALGKDKYVKVKGLGTFKLIEIESRESINVNTGERFEIQGHRKVSFTPDAALKEIINKPFAHFETVVLNDNTVLEDTPIDTGGDEEDDLCIVTMDNTAAEENGEPQQAETEEIEKTKETREAGETKEVEKEVAEECGHEEGGEPPRSSTTKYFIGIVILVIVLCAGVVGYMYYPDLLQTSATEYPETEQPATPTMPENAPLATEAVETAEPEHTAVCEKDTVVQQLAVRQPALPDTLKQRPAVPSARKKDATPFTADSVGYTIVGTETTHTIKEGETLTRVSLQFYGTKALWPYLVKHNPGVIKNPDNVPYGTTIRIPKLVKK